MFSRIAFLNQKPATPGVTWQSVASNQNWNGVAYGNSIFTIGSTGTNKTGTSSDGINWTFNTTNPSMQNMFFFNGNFISLGTAGNKYDSTDGVTWNTRTSVIPAATWNAMAWNNATSYCAVGANGVITTTNINSSWTTRTPAESNNWTGLAFGNSVLVAVSSNGTNRCMTASGTGVTWTSRSIATSVWRDVTYGNSLFVAVASSGTNKIATSPDGTTWTNRSIPEDMPLYGITYGNGLFVAVGDSGSNRIMTSTDGTTWTVRTAPELNGWTEVAYGGNKFVAVAGFGAGTHKIMRSP